MKGTFEPALTGWFVPLWLVFNTFCLPLTGNGMPPLDGNGALAFPPNLVAGLPDWAFKFIIVSACQTGVMALALALLFLRNTGPSRARLSDDGTMMIQMKGSERN